MAQMQVGIGHNFFRKSLNDYSNWYWAFPREAMQNSMDAPHSKNINVWVAVKDGNTQFMWDNDGDPMTYEILTGKLLTLGESGKDFQGTVGGFGKAKEILLMAHLDYEINTGRFHVVGSGGNYNIEEREESASYPGTCTKVTIQGDVMNSLVGNLKNFLLMAQWHGTVKINGEIHKSSLRKGARRREFDWATVYTNRMIENRIVIRVNGIPMFFRHLDCNKRCVVVELKAGTADVLMSNRDSLKYDYRSQLDAFIDEITVDKMSALRDESPTYLHYKGDKMRSNCYGDAARDTMEKIITAAYANLPIQETDEVPTSAAIVDEKVGYAPPEKTTHERGTKSRLSYEFLVKNTTGMTVPTHYLPSDFSEYSTKLAKIWAKVIVALHDLFGEKREFSIGFIFDDEDEAQFEANSGYGDVYFINPITIIKQIGSNSRSMAKRWKFNAAGRWAILAVALHEYIHGAVGLGGHDELYSAQLTTMAGVLLRERQKFNSCFV